MANEERAKPSFGNQFITNYRLLIRPYRAYRRDDFSDSFLYLLIKKLLFGYNDFSGENGFIPHIQRKEIHAGFK